MTDQPGLPQKPPRTPIPLSVLIEPLRKPFHKHRILLISTILAGWGKFIVPLTIPLVVQKVLDQVITPEAIATRGREAVMGDLRLYGGICLLAILFASIAAYFRSSLAQRLAARVQHSLRHRVFRHLQRLSMAFFQQNHSGSLGTRVSGDINHAGVLIDKGIVQYAIDGVLLLITLGLLLTTNAWLAIATVTVLALNAFILNHYTPRIRLGRKRIQEGQSGMSGQAAEFFAGISLVKAAAGERETGQIFDHRSTEVLDLMTENSRINGAFHALSNGCVQLALWTVVFLGGWMVVAQPGWLTHGELVKFIMLIGALNGAVQRLIDAMAQIQDGFAALERINDVLAVAPTPADAPEATEPPITGELAFSDVTFGYSPEVTVINGFSFTFRQGRTYALVGPSGSGKSSLCQLMLRFYDPLSGTVTIDGHDLRSIRQQHYRQHVAVVLQDPIIFSSTVHDNIDFGVESPTLEQVRAAARKAQAHDFIEALPDGYDTRLGERGVALSGGQRQRVAIARALMREPQVLILDEATSALDTVTERSIQDVIDHLRGSCTIIVIAHRLSTIRNVDEILVLDHGRIAEHGSFDDLMARGGLFADLAQNQERAAG